MLGKLFARSLLLFCFFSVSAFAEVPSFSEYKVDSVYKGQNHPLIKIDTAGERWDELRKKAAISPVNFAGHYIVFTGECAGGSICGEVIDAETGEVVRSLPNAYKADVEEADDSFDISYQIDSRLIVIMGVSQNREVDANNNKVSRKYRTRYYEFDGQVFHLVASEDK